jgi:hypothetical protein
MVGIVGIGFMGMIRTCIQFLSVAEPQGFTS